MSKMSESEKKALEYFFICKGKVISLWQYKKGEQYGKEN